jgi:CheY-like chemotaxis protein
MATVTENNLRILVVDDERVVADSLALILNARGYHAKAVYCAEAAIEESVLLAPDVLISDVVMARMSGIDLAVHITNTVPICKILLISGQPETANLLLEAEAKGYRFELLNKPVHPEVVLQRIAAYLTSLSEMTESEFGGLELREN